MAKNDVVQFYGVKETIKLMRKFEPEMLKDLRRDIRSITKPAVSSIKSTSPKIGPLSGMRKNGRTSYTIPKINVRITPSAKSYGFGYTTTNLVAITATGSGKNVGFDIADIAGRGPGGGQYATTRPFVDPRTGQTVRRKINGQGKNLIQVLNQRSKNPPSRYVYGPIEDTLPVIRREVAHTLDKTINEFNRKLWRI